MRGNGAGAGVGVGARIGLILATGVIGGTATPVNVDDRFGLATGVTVMAGLGMVIGTDDGGDAITGAAGGEAIGDGVSGGGANLEQAVSTSRLESANRLMNFILMSILPVNLRQPLSLRLSSNSE